MKLSIKDNSDKKSMREANRWGKFSNLHYMVADQDIDSWRQEDYINVMYACRDLRRTLDTYEKYGIDYENDPKYAERVEDMNAKISELIDIANQNAAQWAGESIVREDRSEYVYNRGKKCFVEDAYPADWRPSRDEINRVFSALDQSDSKNPDFLNDSYGFSKYTVRYSDSGKESLFIYAAMDDGEYRFDETFYIYPDNNRDTYKISTEEFGDRTVGKATDVWDIISTCLRKQAKSGAVESLRKRSCKKGLKVMAVSKFNEDFRSRRDVVDIDPSIGSHFKRGMNTYDADLSFKKDGITYFIEISDAYGTNTIGYWWDNSDNGFGYNNCGQIAVQNDFGRNTGNFSPETLDDYILIYSNMDRQLPDSIKRLIVNKIRNKVDYDGLNLEKRRTESKSLKKESQESSSPYYDFQNFLGRIDDYIDENGILLETKGTRFVNGKYNQTFEIILYGAYSNEEITTISLDYELRDGYLPWSATFDFAGTYDEDSADYINDLYDTITGWIDEVVKNDYQ